MVECGAAAPAAIVAAALLCRGDKLRDDRVGSPPDHSPPLSANAVTESTATPVAAAAELGRGDGG